VQKEIYIAEEKERIAAEIKDRLRKDEINLKIEKSKKENAQRIDNMRETNVLIQKLYKEAKVKIVQNQKSQASAYENMMKDLILQV
jgi:hypothetical protein